MDFIMRFNLQDVTASQCKDSGMALVLLCLLLAVGTSSRNFLLLGIGLLIVTMTVPVLLKPFARLWFGLSHALGAVVSGILLTLLFFLMVTPLGLLRRILGKDSMQMKKWKQGESSVFQERDHLFSSEDLENPY
jgi:energy-coupling factor transporter transmembrane protein EcfT